MYEKRCQRWELRPPFIKREKLNKSNSSVKNWPSQKNNGSPQVLAYYFSNHLALTGRWLKWMQYRWLIKCHIWESKNVDVYSGFFFFFLLFSPQNLQRFQSILIQRPTKYINIDKNHALLLKKLFLHSFCDYIFLDRLSLFTWMDSIYTVPFKALSLLLFISLDSSIHAPVRALMVDMTLQSNNCKGLK